MWQWNPEGIPLKKWWMVIFGKPWLIARGWDLINCQRVGFPTFVHISHEIVDQRNWELEGNQHWNPCDLCDLYASSSGPPWRDHLFIWRIRHGDPIHMGADTTPHHFRTHEHLATRSEVHHHILCNASGPWARSTCSNFFVARTVPKWKNLNFKKQRFSHHGMSLSARFHAVPWTSFYFLLSFLFIHRHDLFPMARSSSAQNLFSPGADLCLDRLARGYQRRFKRPYQDAQKHSWNIGKVLKHGVKYQFCGSIGVSRSTLCELIFSWDNLGSYSVLQQGQRWQWISQTHKLHW